VVVSNFGSGVAQAEVGPFDPQKTIGELARNRVSFRVWWLSDLNPLTQVRESESILLSCSVSGPD